MDENDDYFRIGEQLLTRHLNSISNSDTEDDDNSIKEENQRINNNIKRDILYAKCNVIYHFFLSNGISSFSQPLTQNLKDQVDSEIANLLEILETEGKTPSIANFQNNILNYNNDDRSAEFLSHFDALNILSFSLLLSRRNEQSNQNSSNTNNSTTFYDKLLDGRSDEIVQHEQLKEKYKRLLSRLKEYETIFTLLAKKMNLPDNSDLSTIASELALFNFNNNNNNNNQNLKNEDIHDNKLKNYLTSRFSIAKEQSTDEIIQKIEMELNLLKKANAESNENDNSIKKFIIQMTDMPEDSDENDVKIKIGSVLDEIQTMKSEIKFLNDKLSQQKKQIQETLDKLQNQDHEKDSKNLHVSFDFNRHNQNQYQNQMQAQKEKVKHSEETNPDKYILSSEVESLKLSLQNIREKNKTVRDQNKLLKKISKDAINESRDKTNTITELTIKINELTLQNNELERNFAEQKKQILKSKSKDSNQNFSEAFDYLSSQIEIQTNELSQISENRNYLYTIIHKQEKVIDFLTKELLEIKEEPVNNKEKESVDMNDKNNSTDIQLLEKHLISLAEENKRSDIISILSCNNSNDILVNDDNNNEKVLISMNEAENKYSNSIISAFSMLLKSNEENIGLNCINKDANIIINNNNNSFNNDKNDNTTEAEKVDYSSFKEVCEYLSSLLVFFDKIANSSDTLDWICSSSYYSDDGNGQNPMGLNINPYLDASRRAVRETLMALVQRITYFLEDRQIDFVAPDFLHITDAIFKKNSGKDLKKNKIDNEKDKNSDSDNNDNNIGNVNFDYMNNENDSDNDNSYLEDEISAIAQQRIFVALTVADVLKNYSTRLEEKVDELGVNLRELKDELVQAEMVMNDSKGLLESEQRKNRKLNEELNNVKTKLKNEKIHRKQIEAAKESAIENTEMAPVERTNVNNNNNITVSLNNDSNGFYYYNQAMRKNDDNEREKIDNEEKKKYQKLIKVMKKKFEKIIKEQEKKINVLSDKLIDTQNELQSNKEVNEQLSKENKELTETMSVMTERLSQFEIEKDVAVTARTAKIENDYEEKLNEQKNLNKELLDNLNEMQKKVEQAEENQNIENRNLQNENKELFTKIEEIKANYEALIESYKQRYSEFSEREKKMAEENAIQTESLKKLNKELNDARIESKICALKNKTLTEKFDRQESLHLTKTTAMSVNFETTLNEKLKMAEIDYENRQKKFLKQLFEQLKDFYDFTRSMSEENCLKIVSNLVSQLKTATMKEKQMKKVAETLDEMKSELHVKSDSELLTKVLLLSSLSSPAAKKAADSESRTVNADDDDIYSNDEQFVLLRGKMVAFESLVKSWRRWANCMNSMLSDNFSSFNTTSAAFQESIKLVNQNDQIVTEADSNVDSELRSKVEEKILSAVGRRRIFRRIEILRNEKIIFLKLLNEFGSLNHINENGRGIGLQTLICVAISMRRIQKISGKLPSISLGNGPGSMFTLGNNGNASIRASLTFNNRYDLEEKINYPSSENSNYDETYEKNSNSQFQHKKKPIISCT